MRTEIWKRSIGNLPLFIDNEESAYFERQAYSIKYSFFCKTNVEQLSFYCMAKMDKTILREVRKQKFAQMEQQLKEIHPKEEDSIFYYHSSEDRIVLSHALFWTMTLPQFFKSKLRKEKLPSVTTFSPRDSLSKLRSPLGLPKEFFLLLRQYQEEMLDAFLLDDDYFSELLHYCTLMYEIMPTILMSSYLREEKILVDSLPSPS